MALIIDGEERDPRNENWTIDGRWRPTKEFCQGYAREQDRPVDKQRQGGGYFCVYDSNGNRRDDRVRYG